MNVFLIECRLLMIPCPRKHQREILNHDVSLTKLALGCYKQTSLDLKRRVGGGGNQSSPLFFVPAIQFKFTGFIWTP
jgi:hypothetical protein